MFAGGTPDRSIAAYWDSGTIPWLASGEVNQWLIESPTTYITKAGLANSSATWIPSGSIVVALAGQGRTKGMVAQLAFAATCNQSLAAIIPDSRIHARYLLWWLAAHYETLRNLAGGELRDGLNLEIIRSVPCPLPPNVIQTAIADFLDAETSRIDRVVTTRRRMIELLNERFRLYCLNQTTNAPAVPLRRVVVSIQTGRTPDTVRHDYYEEGTIDWYSPGDFGDVLELESPQRFVSQVAKHEGAIDLFPANSTLVVGIGATAGRVAHLDHVAASNQQITCIHTNERMRSRFLSWQLWARSEELRGTAPYTTLPILTNDFLANLRVSVPEIQTQELLAQQLDEKASILSAARTKLEAEINLLQERRESLVTAAVIGQIPIPGVGA